MSSVSVISSCEYLRLRNFALWLQLALYADSFPHSWLKNTSRLLMIFPLFITIRINFDFFLGLTKSVQHSSIRASFCFLNRLCAMYVLSLNFINFITLLWSICYCSSLILITTASLPSRLPQDFQQIPLLFWLDVNPIVLLVPASLASILSLRRECQQVPLLS